MLKRLLVLAVALALFVTAFLVYFHVSDARIDHDFRAEREKFHVEGLELTTATPPAHEILAPSTPPPLPAAAVPIPSAETPGGAPTGGNPADAPLDSNSLIGPVPPASSNTPDATPDNSTTPATNASPASTFVYPGLRQLPSALMTFSTGHSLRIQTPTDTPAVPAVPATAAPPVTPAAKSAVTPEPAGTNAEVQTPALAPAVTETKIARTPAGPGSVIVLGFHQFNPPGVRGTGPRFVYNMPQDVFDGEMKFLKDNHYNVVPLSDVVAFAKREKNLPPNSVAVTIDDGYKSSIVYAAPILKKYGFPWTFFVYPAFITTHESKGAASWDDLVELEKEGVDVECHSMTHPFLSRPHGKTPEQYDAWLTVETAGAKAEIEQHLNKQVKYFAYPFGDYNKEVEAKTIGAGFQAIFTVAGNPIHPGTNVYAMGRYVITAPVEKEFASYLHEGALGLADINPQPGSIVTDPRPVISAVLGYAGKINPASIIAEVGNMGEVRYDFDPKSLVLRLYLPRDLVQAAEKVNIRAKDADTGQTMVASWHFNYQATAAGVTHAPIGTTPTRKKAAAQSVAPPAPEATTNAAESSDSNAPAATVPATAAAPAPASNAAPILAVPAEQAAPAPASNAVPPAPTTP
jgi:peptidoglycan/xylan/chitin deacetylase (PgdA/CDA1 family)